MNYWPAEVTNLSECHEPLFRMIKECSETGISVAREHYNCNGWVIHHNTDLWRGAALFYSEYLVEDPATGWLISTPSNSPENGGMVSGPTMDHQIIRSLFNACIEAAGILESDQQFAAKLKELTARIAPNQIGQYGQLQEWIADVDDPQNKHRHVSHLWGIHPARDINWETSPELMKAAKQSLIFRGDDGTGWSLAWKINFWSRLLDGDHTYELIKMIFRPVSSDPAKRRRGGGSYANLFDAHPPFQIDGNFGATAGIVEMLIQSHLSAIDILPALPSVLPEGNISGVCARGGFELSFSWEEGKLSRLKILSKAGEPCRLRYRDHEIEFTTNVGETYHFDGQMSEL